MDGHSWCVGYSKQLGPVQSPRTLMPCLATEPRLPELPPRRLSDEPMGAPSQGARSPGRWLSRPPLRPTTWLVR